MAKTVSNFPDLPPRTIKYPWHEWFDGQIWELAHGTDFKSTTANFRKLASDQAEKRGIKLRLAATTTHVWVQALAPGRESGGVL